MVLMADLFLDIETVPDFTPEEYFRVKKAVEGGQINKSVERDLFWKYRTGGLNPFEGKLILLTYKINDGHIFRLKEWELGERELLTKFYDLLKDLQYNAGEDRLRIIGHNILRFDLFFLYERMRYYFHDDTKWLHQRVINKPEVIDFLQMHLALNNFQTKGLRHDVLAYAYGFSQKITLGSEETFHYYEKNYDKIIDYSIREFIYPELYKKIQTDGLVSQDILLNSIKLYDESIRTRNVS